MLYLFALLLLTAAPLYGQTNEPQALFDREWSVEYEETMVERMADGIDRFFDGYKEEVVSERSTYWSRNLSSGAAYVESIAENRQRFREIVGLVDERVPVRMQRYGWNDNGTIVAATERYTIEQVRWPVFEGVWGAGLLLTPRDNIAGRVVALPDADQLPEELAGLTDRKDGRGTSHTSEDGSSHSFAQQLAASGTQVLVPTLLSRQATFSRSNNVAPWNPYRGDAGPDTLITNQTHREWIYRQAYVHGRHVIGLELQKVFAGIDWLVDQSAADNPAIGVAGYGEGGLLALYAGALDRRIDATLVSGYFGPREELWSEPVYRNVWGLLKRFGDAEIASMIAPRSLVIEYSQGPEIDGPPPAPEGVRPAATAGSLSTPSFNSAQNEVDRLRAFFEAGPLDPSIAFVHGPVDDRRVRAGSDEALTAFADQLGVGSIDAAAEQLSDRREQFDPAERQGEQVRQLTDYLHDLLDTQDRVRYDYMEGDWSSPQAWHESMDPYREYLREEIIGRVDQKLLPPNPRLRKVYDREHWVGYEVVLDVWPDVFAWGVLAVPKDVESGEERPTVIVQHGHAGTPSTPVRADSYNNILPRLAERGFVVFAPHNPYQFNIRKATPLKASVFSVIIPQYHQIVNWLQTREHVDPDRIGYYGKSWGGRTAMRVPVFVDELQLAICSANFFQWPREAMTVNYGTTYLRTSSIGVYEFNAGPTLGHAEMVMLQAPKPFMVESGYTDGVAVHEWTAYEFAKVQRVYDILGVGDRVELGFHIGGHEVHADTVFPFLHEHLNWPVPATD